jgi:tRNA(fMet)-specific endonuclease VapC
MYLLDTNTLIYFFKGEGNVAARMFEHSPSQIAIPSLVVYELEVGIAKSSSPKKREQQLKMLLENVIVIPFGNEEARVSAKIRASLEALGEPIGPIDTLIAGCALAHNYTLVTRNQREFGKVKGLKVENWYL